MQLLNSAVVVRTSILHLVSLHCTTNYTIGTLDLIYVAQVISFVGCRGLFLLAMSPLKCSKACFGVTYPSIIYFAKMLSGLQPATCKQHPQLSIVLHQEPKRSRPVRQPISEPNDPLFIQAFFLGSADECILGILLWTVTRLSK